MTTAEACPHPTLSYRGPLLWTPQLLSEAWPVISARAHRARVRLVAEVDWVAARTPPPSVRFAGAELRAGAAVLRLTEPCGKDRTGPASGSVRR